MTQLSLLAGDVGGSGNADGSPGAFNFPAAMAGDDQGRVFVADTYNCSIRQITLATGQVSTLAGKSGACGSANSSDGTGATARFYYPRGISYSAPSGAYAQGRLFVADTYNNTIRAVDVATGATTTLAGAAGSSGSANSSDGTGATALFDFPYGISYSAPDAVYSQGRLFVADSNNHTIRAVDVATGATTALAGAAGVAGNNNSSDGTGATARFYYPRGISYSAPSGAYAQGRLFVADTYNNTIRQVDVATAAVSTLAGSASNGGSANGTGAAARFIAPEGISTSAPSGVYTQGRLFVAATGNHTIRQVDLATGAVSTLAGAAGSSGSANGTGVAARFSSPRGISASAPNAIYPQGRLFVADSSNHMIRQINVATGAVSILAGLAGSGGGSGSADGTGVAARFYNPYGISYSEPSAAYTQGRLFVADTSNHTIRQIDVATGVVSTLAGLAGSYGPANGTGAAARFNTPRGISYSEPSGAYTQGRLFVADTYNNTIRQIDVATGVVSTLAGQAGSAGSTDGTGTAARFNTPRDISYSAPSGVYTQGRLFVADRDNHTIRQIDIATGAVTTVLGQAGQSGFRPGAAPGVLNTPVGVAVSGNALYITMQNGVVQVAPLP